jgi:subtilisin family serine protease
MLLTVVVTTCVSTLPGTGVVCVTPVVVVTPVVGVNSVVLVISSVAVGSTYAPLCGVVVVSATGAANLLSWFSTYGMVVDVAAPGGSRFQTPKFDSARGRVLAPYSANASDLADEAALGRLVQDSTGAYWAWLNGTSMAAPHAAGVAALIVSKFGSVDTAHGGLTMDPDAVASKLRDSASEHACPRPRTVDYTIVGRPASWNATCNGSPQFNDFYGHGIVNALAAVGG